MGLKIRTITNPAALRGSFSYPIDGGGSAISAPAEQLQRIQWGFAGEVTEVVLLADQPGDIEIDIWQDTYANYPPAVADTITASALPTLSSAIKSQDTTLTGWTKTFSKGDVWLINVATAATLTHVDMQVHYRKTGV